MGHINSSLKCRISVMKWTWKLGTTVQSMNTKIKVKMPPTTPPQAQTIPIASRVSLTINSLVSENHWRHTCTYSKYCGKSALRTVIIIAKKGKGTFALNYLNQTCNYIFLRDTLSGTTGCGRRGLAAAGRAARWGVCACCLGSCHRRAEEGHTGKLSFSSPYICSAPINIWLKGSKKWPLSNNKKSGA